MNNLNIPASRAYSEALTAYEANEDAIRSLTTRREKLLADEETARAAVSGGDSSEKVLDALTANVSKAAALLPAIDSLQAQRGNLRQAVYRATGEDWAKALRTLAPEGTYAALQAVRDDLAETIRTAVSEARERAENLVTEAGHLIDQARQLDQVGALPRGAAYSPVSGLKIDGRGFVAASTASFAEDVGRALDTEHAGQVRTALQVRDAEAQRARAAENAALNAQYAAAMVARTAEPAR